MLDWHLPPILLLFKVKRLVTWRVQENRFPAFPARLMASEQPTRTAMTWCHIWCHKLPLLQAKISCLPSLHSFFLPSNKTLVNINRVEEEREGNLVLEIVPARKAMENSIWRISYKDCSSRLSASQQPLHSPPSVHNSYKPGNCCLFKTHITHQSLMYWTSVLQQSWEVWKL